MLPHERRGGDLDDDRAEVPVQLVRGRLRKAKLALEPVGLLDLRRRLRRFGPAPPRLPRKRTADGPRETDQEQRAHEVEVCNERKSAVVRSECERNSERDARNSSCREKPAHDQSPFAHRSRSAATASCRIDSSISCELNFARS